MSYILLIIGIAVSTFIWWRYTSVVRGARQRDAKLLTVLNPLIQRFRNKESVASKEILTLARRPQLRSMIYEMLKRFEQIHLFPVEYLTPVAQGEAVLAYWLMHPNELQEAPMEIVLVERIERERDNETAIFFVYRYIMPSGHWAEKDGWLLGLAGPFFPNDVPYSGAAGGFSRSTDKYNEVKPSDLIDWYIGLVTTKRT